MKLPKTWRQGDVLIQLVEAIPKGLPQKDRTTLLEGETSGHWHELKGGTVLEVSPTQENNYNLGYFELTEETELVHPEHDTIVLAPGKYKFFAQREYDEQEERQVID